MNENLGTAFMKMGQELYISSVNCVMEPIVLMQKHSETWEAQKLEEV